MKRADLTERDRLLLAEVRDMMRGLAAAMSLDLEERLAQLEALIKQRRTVVIRRPHRYPAPSPSTPRGRVGDSEHEAPHPADPRAGVGVCDSGGGPAGEVTAPAGLIQPRPSRPKTRPGATR